MVSPVARGDVPIEVLVAAVANGAGQARHDALAVISGDGIGRATWKADEAGDIPDLLLDHLADGIQVVVVCGVAGVDSGVVVRVRVQADGVPAVVGLLDEVVVLGAVARDEEGRLDPIAVEHVEYLGRQLGGPVVDGEVDDLLVCRGAGPLRAVGVYSKVGIACGKVLRGCCWRAVGG